MKRDQIEIGHLYVAKVSGKQVAVRIDRESPHGGWDGTNMATKRAVRIKSARRLRRPVRASQYSVRRPTIDPDKCSRSGCPGDPVMTYKGKPMCQACWDHQAEEKPGATDAEKYEALCQQMDEAIAAEEAAKVNEETPNKETDMPTKKKSKTTKARTPKTKKDPAEKKPKRVSALDAAAQVLSKAKEPMSSKAIVEAMAEAGLWKSPGGATPHATLYSAMVREITTKGKDSRFKKNGGQFCAA